MTAKIFSSIFICKFSSSDDEFDQPIRDYIEKTMSQPNKTKTSSSTITTSNAFANEMEDELDQIYHNFIARGTFELPLSSKDNKFFILINQHVSLFCFLAQKTPEKKKVILNEENDADSDDDDDDDEVEEQSKKFY